MSRAALIFNLFVAVLSLTFDVVLSVLALLIYAGVQ